MNKIKFTIIATLFIFAGVATACTNTTQKNNSVSTNTTATPKPTPSATIDPEIRTENLMGIYIGKDESQIGLGLDTTTIKEVLGKADEVKKKNVSQEKNDKKQTASNQTWYYKDLDTTITFEKSGNTYTVSSIEGGKKATTLKTGGGITAGSSRKDIVKAYKEQLGEDADTSKNKIVIDNMGYSQLVFTLKKDKVVGITMELL